MSGCYQTFPACIMTEALSKLGGAYHNFRRDIMLTRQEGLTKTYNCFHSPAETAEDIARLRDLHAEMDRAVAAAYGWGDLDLGHGFHATKQGLRFTLSEAARRAVLDRLLALNHERHAAEVRAGLHDNKNKGKTKQARKGAGKADGGQGEFVGV